jgi:hypothetical protein
MARFQGIPLDQAPIEQAPSMAAPRAPRFRGTPLEGPKPVAAPAPVAALAPPPIAEAPAAPSEMPDINPPTMPQAAPQQPAAGGLGAQTMRFAKDAGASVVAGTGSIMQFPGQVYGLATGDFDTMSTRGGEAVRQFGQSLKSPEMQEKERQAQAVIAEAEKDGFGAEVGAVLKTYLSDPVLLANFTVEQLPSLLATMGFGKLAQWGTQVAAKVAQRGAVSAGTLSRAGQAGAITGGAAMQGASVGDETRDAILRLPDATFAASPAFQALVASGIDPQAAKEQLALKGARLAGAAGAGISGATATLLPGAERMAFGQGSTQGIIRRVLTGGAAEGLQEGLEEGGGRFAQNVAVQQIDPDQSLLQGVGAQGTMGALPGAVTGAGVAALSGGPSAEAPVPPPAAPAERIEPTFDAPTQPPPPPNPRAEARFGTGDTVLQPAPLSTPRSRSDLAADLADPRPIAEIDAERQQRAREQQVQLASQYGYPAIGSAFTFTLPDGETVQGVMEGVQQTSTEGLARIRGADGQMYVLGADEFTVTEGTGDRADPVVVKTAKDVDIAAQQVEAPTPAQAEAGNYKHAHLEWEGFDIAIETPKGGTRSGVGKDGKPWSVTMPEHYGRIKGTIGADGDQIDITIGPNPEQNGVVWVIDQIDPDTGKFDEHKIMAGFEMGEEAEQAYIDGFSDGRGIDRIGAVERMDLAQLRQWIANGNTKKALAYNGTPKYREYRIPAPSPTPGDNYRGGQRGPAFDLPASQPAPAAEPPQAPAEGAPSRENGAAASPEPAPAPAAQPEQAPDWYKELTETGRRLLYVRAGFTAGEVNRRAKVTWNNISPEVRKRLETAAKAPEAAQPPPAAPQKAPEPVTFEVKSLETGKTSELTVPANPPARNLDMDRAAFKGALEKTGAARYGGADYVIAEGPNGGFYFRRTKDGNRIEKGAGYPGKWAREEAIRRATLEAFSDTTSRTDAIDTAPEPSRAPPVIDDRERQRQENVRKMQEREEAPRPNDAFFNNKQELVDYLTDRLPKGYEVDRGGDGPGSPVRLFGPGDKLIDEWVGAPERSQIDKVIERAKKAAADAAKPAPSNYGADNKLVSADRAAEIRAKLKAKLSGTQINSGIDPEILALGTELAAFHIEAGARKFKDFAQRVANDLGASIQSLRPYLRSWYTGAQLMMEDSGLDVTDMDTPDQVRAALAEMDGKAVPKPTPAEPKTEKAPADEAKPKAPFEGDTDNARLIRAFMNALINGRSFPSIAQAREIAKPIVGRIEPGTSVAKMVDEAFEAAVVQAARVMVADGRENGRTAPQIFDQLVDLYNRQPPLNVRTSTSVANQAYSTPIPLAWLASEMAGIKAETRVYEPSAGNGALLIGVEKPSNAIANEINAERAASLRAQGFKVTTVDASEPAQGTALRTNNDVDAVIANPPFGVVKDENRESKSWQINDRYRTNEIDHAISLRSLEAMPDDGKAVLIIGGVAKTAASQEARSEAYRGKAKVQFYLTLYQQYNVVDHFTVAGELYERQGAGWPVDVIVIDGRGKSERKIPSVDVPTVFRSWDDLKEKFDAARGIARPARDEVSRPDVSDDGRGTAGSDGQPGPAPVGPGADGVRDSAAGQPGKVRGGRSAKPDSPGLFELAPQPAKPSADQDGGRADNRPDDSGRPGLAAPERAEKPGEKETSHQVAYSPASAGEPLGTLAPVNMRDAMGSALDALKERVGDIDSFVAKQLGYEAKNLDRYFAAEQIDAIALGINNFDQGKGFIIGDQTGIGKGRVVAAMIRYALRKGAVPIFATEKPGLYADMWRDMTDIGIPEMLGREIKPLMTNANESVPLDDEGEKFLKSPTAGKHNADLARFGSESDLGGHDVVFTTYSQMQTVKGQLTPRSMFLDAIAPRSILILDESHNAGGQGSEKDDRKKKGSAPNRAEFVRNLVGKARAVFYSSATYAKRPGVMDLYSKTDMPIAVDGNSEKLGAAVEAGGVPLQQAVASMLARAGQYVRRERSFDGVSYDVETVSLDVETYKQFSQILAAINSYYERHVRPAIGAIDDDVKAEGEAVGHDAATGQAGVNSTSFSSLLHNVISQMLVALKADPAADKAIEAARRGEKPVITLANTMGSFLDDYAESTNTGPGQALQISMRDLMLKQLERQRHYTIKKPWSSEKAVRGIVSDAQLGQSGVAAEKQIRELISRSRLGNLPASPIDWIHKRLREAGLKSGEITGRKSALSYETDGTIRYRVRPTTDTKTAGKRARIAEFNDGRLDVMILNQSGSTGISLHASEKFKDQRKRVMVIAQAEANIDTHMQMLGRVHRTGQVIKPAYIQLVGNVPAEKRPAAVLQKKMASLNANTTASRSSALTAKDVPDFMNEYGDRVAVSVMAENHDLHRALGEPIKFEDSGDVQSGDGAMRKVTGRIPLLPLEQQENLYALLEAEYEALIAQLDAMGENALEAKTMALDAKTEKKVEAVKSKGGSSPFAEGVWAETVDVKRLGKPFSSSQVIDQIAETLGQNAPAKDNPVSAIAELEGAGRKQAIESGKAALERFGAYKRFVLDDMEDGAPKEQATVRLNDLSNRFNRLMGVLSVGAQVRLETDGGNFYAVVTKISEPDAKKVRNPLALGSWKVQFAMADSSRQLTLPMSQLEHADNKTDRPNIVSVRPMEQIGDLPVIRAFDQMQSDRREKRVIFTGNMLAAVALLGKRGQMVNFQDNDGTVRVGVLMARDFDAGKFLAENPVALPTGDQVVRFVERSGETAFSKDDAVEVAPLPNGNVRISVARAKGHGGKYYLDRGVLDAAGKDFGSVGQKMRVDLNPISAQRAIDAMVYVGAKFEARSAQAMAKKITGVKGGEEMQSLRNTGRARNGEKVKLGAPIVDRRLDALRATLYADLRAELDRIALTDVALNLPDYIARGDGKGGVQYSAGRQRFWGDAQVLIEIALTESGGNQVDVDPTLTLHHEAVHAMKRLNLFSPAEWKVLAAKSEAVWVNEFGLVDKDSGYKNLPKNLILEEGIARAYEAWKEGQEGAVKGGLIARAFAKIKRFIEAIGNVFRGRGFNTVEGLFEKIDFGEIGARGRMAKGAYHSNPRKNFKPMYADAWHGSPHKFDKFTTDKIGTGEGAQAFGWGLYFAGRKQVAEYYRDKLSDPAKQMVVFGDNAILRRDGKPLEINRDWVRDAQRVLEIAQDSKLDLQETIKALREHRDSSMWRRLMAKITTGPLDEKLLSYLDRKGAKIGPKPGRLYKVTLAPGEDAYLLWDRDLDEQSEKVRQALEGSGIDLQKAADEIGGGDPGSLLGGDLYNWIAEQMLPNMPDDPAGTPKGWGYVQRGDEGQKAASVALRTAGVAGIKYLDGQSRRKDDGAYNYVIFDESDVRIDEMYSLLPKDQASPAESERMAELAGEELVSGTERDFVNDAGLVKRWVVHPRTIAAYDKDFVPVYRAAVRQFETRDEFAAEIARKAQAYTDLTPEDRAQVDKLLELGRLEGTVYGDAALKDGVTNDPEANEGRTENAVLTKPGETVTLTDRQIEGYKAARASMNTALDLFKAQIIEEWGYDPTEIRSSADILALITDETSDREAEQHKDAAKIVREIEQAQRTGYVPFTRWGQIGIAVRRADSRQMALGIDGEASRPYTTIHYEMIEVDGAVSRLMRAARKLKGRKTAEQLGQFPEVKVRLDALKAKYEGDPDVRFSVFQVGDGGPLEQGVKLSDLDMLAEVGRIDDKAWEQVREQLEKAIKMRGFRKHFFGSKNLPGYSVDFERAIADYTIGIAGYLARRKYGSIWDGAIGKIPTTKPKLREYAQKYRDYTQSPQEELQMLRQLGFIYYLAGSPASALVNMSQVPLVTVPWLSQFAAGPKVMYHVTKAYKDALAMTTASRGMDVFDPAKAPDDVREAFQKAWDEGFFVPLNTWEMMGTAQARSQVVRRLSKVSRTAVDAIALMFTVAERLNRMVTWIAAYRLGKQETVRQAARTILAKNALARSDELLRGYTPEKFAGFAIDETQLRMGKVNRPAMMRGAGAAIFQFKGFVMQMIELQIRMGTQYQGKRSKVAVASMILLLMLTAGIWGAPFGEDLRDILEFLHRKLKGTDLDLDTELRELVVELTGSPGLAEAISRGAPRAAGVDLQRIGMGNILPGDAVDVGGIPLDLTVGRLSQAIEHAKRGAWALATAELLPTFIKNPIVGVSWGTEGVRSQASGRVVIPPEKVTYGDVALKAAGFTPADIANQRESERAQTRANTATKEVKDRYIGELARLRADILRADTANDTAKSRALEERFARTLDEIRAFNEGRPLHEMVIVNPKTLKDRVKEELSGAAVRDKNAPKQARPRREEIERIYGEQPR